MESGRRPPAASASVSFTDVKDSDFYAKAVAWAVEKGITNGTGDGKFSSDDTCTRAQCAAFLYRAAGSPEVTDAAAFSDVAADAYYAKAVAWAEKNGSSKRSRQRQVRLRQQLHTRSDHNIPLQNIPGQVIPGIQQDRTLSCI